MIDLKTLISKTVKRNQANSKIKDALILSFFNQAVKKFFKGEFNGKVSPLYFKEGNLIVASLSATVVEKIKKEECKIVDYINKNLEENLVDKINYLT